MIGAKLSDAADILYEILYSNLHTGAPLYILVLNLLQIRS